MNVLNKHISIQSDCQVAGTIHDPLQPKKTFFSQNDPFGLKRPKKTLFSPYDGASLLHI